MDNHGVACKYGNIRVVKLDCCRHRAENAWYLVSSDRIRVGICFITNASLNIVSLKMSLRTER